MNVGIDEIFEYLSSDNCEEVQRMGITLASKINSLSVFIMPIEGKSIWENCAEVLVSKTDEELQLYIVRIFEWLQDMNWPGAYRIYDRLMRLSDDIFIPAYKYSLSLAKQTGDHVWEMVLNDLLVERQLQRGSSE